MKFISPNGVINFIKQVFRELKRFLKKYKEPKIIYKINCVTKGLVNFSMLLLLLSIVIFALIRVISYSITSLPF